MKTKTFTRFFLVLTVLAFTFSSQAQTFEEMNGKKQNAHTSNNGFSDVDMGIDILVAQPKDNFAANLNNLSGGMSFYALWKLNNSPIKMGFDINYILYGYHRDSRPLSTTLPEFNVIIERYHNMLPIHFTTQVGVTKGAIRPYAEAFAGFRFLWTNASIQGNQVVNVPGNPSAFASSNITFDACWSYGLGAGLAVRVYEGSDYTLFIRGSARYMYGTTARYLTRDDVKVDISNPAAPRTSYNYRETTTNMFNYQLGVVFSF